MCKPPGPASYITCGVLFAAAVTGLAIRAYQAVVDVDMSTVQNLALFGLAVIAVIAAPCYAWHLRAARLRYERDEARRELRVVENQAWWGCDGSSDDETTLDLSGHIVVPIRRPGRSSRARGSAS